MANVGGSSSGAARVPKAPERREGRWGPSQLVETDFEAFYTEYHFPRETHFRLPSANKTPYTDGVKGEMCFFEAPLKSGGFPRLLLTRTPIRVGTIIISLCLVLDGSVFLARIVRSESSLCWAFGSVPDQYRRDIKGLTSSEQAHVDAILEIGSIDWNALVYRENEVVGGTKRKNSQEVEGSSHGHSSKKRRASPPLGVSEAEEEEAEEAPLARMSSKRAASIGLEDVSPMLSPTSGVHMEIPIPAVKVIREIGTPSFSISLTVPPGQDLPEAAGGVEVHSDTIPSSGVLPSITLLVMEAPLEELCTAGAVVIGDSGISALDLANEPTIPAVDVVGSSVVLSVPSGRGKEPVTRLSSLGDDEEESDSEPSALPSWRSRPYAQPLLNEEMMEDALLTRSLSHCVSLVAALDAAELKHDEELESSRLKLRKLEGDLESQRKLVEELRTVARGTHLQMQTYEARWWT
ncbi:hypothetical protein CJ030_MR8G023503 [Morella rubra]|uniref:Uncharacterized protein n=1 Tax=Morella rubra TaxID=262757 RepID=A0A6A1UT91_9ROSI|nr:hypothetical protein CJ030_MR8G023503 [Morella rubra]